jgi:hypothetical protein
MPNNQAQVISGRDFIVYTVPWNATVIIPPDTIAYGTAWGTPVGQTGAWVEAGYTDGGVTVSIEVTRGEIRVDQELEPILRPATGRNTAFTSTLAQFTPANLKNAAGQGVITSVAAASGTKGHDDLDISSTIADNYIAAGLDFLHPGDQQPFRVVAWKCLVQGNVSAAFNPTDKATIPFALNAFPDTSTTPARIVKFRDVIPALP